MPNWLLKALAVFDSSLRAIQVHIGLRPKFDISTAEVKLGMHSWIGAKQSCIAQAYSLIANGVVPDRSKARILSRPNADGTCLAQERSHTILI
jgi:hypothetical protein